VRLLHAVAFSKKLPWFEPTNVIFHLIPMPHTNVAPKRNSQHVKLKKFLKKINKTNGCVLRYF
jgi:hypothetical protein